MRLKERSLMQVTICPRTVSAGAMGGRGRSFSAGTAVRGSVLPEGGDVQTGLRGDENRGKLRILVPGDTAAAPGDRVTVDGANYLIESVNKWWAHRELLCERMP